MKRTFLYLWIAQSISQFGDALLEITLPVWVGLVTHSPVQVAGVAVAELLPTLAAPIVGRLVDLVSFLLSFGTRIAIPAQTLLLRQFGSVRYQGAFRTASSLALALGPAVGAALLTTLGPTATVIADAATSAISLLLILQIPTEDSSPLPAATGAIGWTVAALWRDVVTVVQDLRESTALMAVSLSTAVNALTGFVWYSVDVFYRTVSAGSRRGRGLFVDYLRNRRRGGHSRPHRSGIVTGRDARTLACYGTAHFAPGSALVWHAHGPCLGLGHPGGPGSGTGLKQIPQTRARGRRGDRGITAVTV